MASREAVSDDPIEMQSCGWFWTMVEVGVGIVATCLPTFGPILFESHAALSSLRTTLSGFVPLLGKDTDSEKPSYQRQESVSGDAESAATYSPSMRHMV